MNSTADRRLVVDQGFTRTIESVLQAFLSAGFSVTPIEGGDLHQRARPEDLFAMSSSKRGCRN